jgi:hypothetical protein
MKKLIRDSELEIIPYNCLHVQRCLSAIACLQVQNMIVFGKEQIWSDLREKEEAKKGLEKAHFSFSVLLKTQQKNERKGPKGNARMN